MPDPRDFLDPVAVAQIERLEIVARHLVEGFLRGHHRSLSRGSSMEFAEHRPYVPGDEIRHLDWRTLAKTDRYYVKQYEDETNLRATLSVDVSASMGFGSAGTTKLRYACCLAAAFGYLLLLQRDAVGLALVDDSLRELVPPRGTADNFAGILTAMERAEARGRTALGPVLHRIAEHAAGRSFILVFSDLLDETDEILRGLADLRHRDCDVVVFHVIDPAEVELPFDRWMVFRDVESPDMEVKLDARQFREVYRRNFANHREVLRKGCAAAEIDYLAVKTDEPFERAITQCVKLRERRG